MTDTLTQILRKSSLIVILATSFLSVTAQKSISVDLFGATYYATENNPYIGVSYGTPVGKQSSLQIGLNYGRFITDRAQSEHTIITPEQDYYRELRGIGLIPEYRYHFNRPEAGENLSGFYMSAYGKFYASWVKTDDYLNDLQSTENGYVIGLGAGLGYLIDFNKWSITPYIGVGKGFSSHKEIFEPGGFAIDFISPDLLIYRFEILVGYNL